MYSVNYMFLIVYYSSHAAARDAILNQEVDSPPSTPPSPIVAKVKENQKAIQRQRAIQELYETERDYHKELSALCSKILPSFKKVNYCVS